MPRLEWQDISISSHVPGTAPVWLVILLYLLVEDLFCRSSIYFCWLHLQLHLPVLPIKGPFWSPTAHYLRWTVHGWWFIFSSHPRKWPMTIHEVSQVYNPRNGSFSSSVDIPHFLPLISRPTASKQQRFQHYSNPQIDGKVNHHQITRDFPILFGDYGKKITIFHGKIHYFDWAMASIAIVVVFVAQVYRRLLNVVALPFSPLASDSLQKKQARLPWSYLGLSENRIYSQWNSHLKTG